MEISAQELDLTPLMSLRALPDFRLRKSRALSGTGRCFVLPPLAGSALKFVSEGQLRVSRSSFHSRVPSQRLKNHTQLLLGEARNISRSVQWVRKRGRRKR